MSEHQPNIPPSVSDVNASTSTAKFRWIQVVELGYIEESEGLIGKDTGGDAAVCFHCGAAAGGGKCSKCQVASYW